MTQNKERPILFSAPMVRALLDDTKTQTRRIVKPHRSDDAFALLDHGDGWWPYRSEDGESANVDNMEYPIPCPYGQPDDRLWVRESFWGCDLPGYGDIPCVVYDDEWTGQEYAPAQDRPWAPKFGRIPSIHMPRAASRILLEVVSVRVERLQDISDEDAIAEGIGLNAKAIGVPLTGSSLTIPRGLYRSLWEDINGAGSWDLNPWVWVVEFQRVDGATGRACKEAV